MSIFNALGGNPFSTPVGSKIEQATDGSLASENWALNMEICDLINETEDGPKDAVKAIRKRLTQNAGKNNTVVLYALTVLETCVKNCGKKFHLLVCAKDFVQELVKLIGPKNSPSTAVQDKVLSLIQSWADAFKHVPECAGVVLLYHDLVNKGIDFPATDLDAMAPIHTPQRTVESIDLPARELSASPVDLPSPPGVLTVEQRAKLQSELDVVQSNMAVFGEIMGEMSRGQEEMDELLLLQDLHATCRKMQERLVDLIGKLPSDELTAELLRVNDDMNNLFLRYSRWEKNREAGSQSATAAVLSVAICPAKPASPTNDAQDNLINLKTPDIATRLSEMTMSSPSAAAHLAQVETVTARNGPQGDDDFDMFAQSRNATYESTKNRGSSYKDNLHPDQVSTGLSSMTRGAPTTTTTTTNKPEEREFDEMANWLGEARVDTEESVTSSEFEKFLAERAAAAESLPPSSPATSANPATNRPKAASKDKEGLLAM